MPAITMTELQEMVKLRQAVIELEQVRILIDAIVESVVIRTTDEEMASAFYLVQDTFNAKLQYIIELLPGSN